MYRENILQLERSETICIKGIIFQKLLSLLFLPLFSYTHISMLQTQGHDTLRGRQANKGVLCLKERTNSLHLSGLEVLQWKRGLTVRGGEIYLPYPPCCAEVLEGWSVLDCFREAKSKGVFSLLLMQGLGKRSPHRLPSQQADATQRKHLS